MMKTRFCPSPTGNLHLGNMRTALFNALYAQQQKGALLLRIEDTDKLRSEDEYTESLKRDLLWLGLQWNEGPDIGGELGPYWQSQRQAIYDTYYEKLIEKGLVYPCFCSEQELAVTRKVQLSSGQPPRYAGTCRELSSEKIAALRLQGKPESLRFRIPKNQVIEFDDLVKGPQKFQSDDIGDFIIRRQDGTPPFMFCNAIDDATMQVTHAIRGEDHLTNTPKQLLILKALELKAPHYGHVSLIFGRDGSPLSKRNGSRSIKELREEGYLPIAVLNYLSRLGHYYENPAFMSWDELVKQFSLASLSVSPARFDPEQLLHWQREAVQRANVEELMSWCQHDVPASMQAAFINAIRGNVLFPDEAHHWARIIFTDHVQINETEQQILSEAGKDFFENAIKLIDVHGTDFKALSQALSQVTGKKGKALFLPLRIALTGQMHGPDMPVLCQLLGVEKMKKRLDR